MSSHTPQIALMIDADNISFRYFPDILKLKPTGQIVHYFVSGGDSALRSWNEPIVKYRFEVVEAKGKDAADVAIEKECFTLTLEQPQIDTFCIVSDDKGYENFINTLRRWGKKVELIRKQDIEKVQKASKSISDESPQTVPPKSAKAPQTAPPKPVKAPQTVPPKPVKAPQTAPPKPVKAPQTVPPKSKEVTQTVPPKPKEAAQIVPPKPAKEVTQIVPPKSKVAPQKTVDFTLPKPLRVITPQTKKFKMLTAAAFALLVDEWVTLTQLESALKKVDNSFQVEDYGVSNISQILFALPDFVERKELNATQWVRLKTPVNKNQAPKTSN